MNIRTALNLSLCCVTCVLALLTLSTTARGQVSITFQGHVKYSDGDPVAGATVTMHQLINGTSSFETTSTDAGGNYSFSASRPVGGELKVRGESQLAQEIIFASRFASGSPSEFLHESEKALKKLSTQSKVLTSKELAQVMNAIKLIDLAFKRVGGA